MLNFLSEIEKKVLVKRLVENKVLLEIAKDLDLTEGRVSVIHCRAFIRMFYFLKEKLKSIRNIEFLDMLDNENLKSDVETIIRSYLKRDSLF